MEGKIKIETILNWKSETKPFHFFLIIESKKTPRSESENLSKRFLCFFRYGPEVFPELFCSKQLLTCLFFESSYKSSFFPTREKNNLKITAQKCLSIRSKENIRFYKKHYRIPRLFPLQHTFSNQRIHFNKRIDRKERIFSSAKKNGDRSSRNEVGKKNPPIA
ncbi:hypothetical protein DLM75_14300 [Leptospira stimsonii]|uniref:Uncharacterized protein n=1 Tax=Leptospira stimsonii TaxID=2202203 RepID=A0A396Z8Y6_9LEPT|nr:hypothetical protein DLM75_14300 [Leptospira stimsonii]